MIQGLAGGTYFTNFDINTINLGLHTNTDSDGNSTMGTKFLESKTQYVYGLKGNNKYTVQKFSQVPNRPAGLFRSYCQCQTRKVTGYQRRYHSEME